MIEPRKAIKYRYEYKFSKIELKCTNKKSPMN